MPDNELELDIDTAPAKQKIAEVRGEIAQLQQQLKDLKNALSDATGGQKDFLQGAIAGTASRLGNLQSSLGNAQTSAVVGGVPPGWGNVTGGFQSPTIYPGWQSVTGRMPTAGGGGAGGFGGGSTPGGFGGGSVPPGWGNITGGFQQPTIPPGWANISAMGGFVHPLGVPTPQMQPTVAMTPTQLRNANYANRMPFGQFDQGSDTLDYARAFRGAVAYSAGSAVSNIFDYQTARLRSGGVDYMAQGQGFGAAFGGIIGGAIGGFATAGNPIGVGLGVAIGSGIGSSAGNFFTAPAQNRADANVTANAFFGARFGPTNIDHLNRFLPADPDRSGIAGSAGTSITPAPGRLQRITNAINRVFENAPEFKTTLPNVAQTFGTVASNLFNYGTDPFGPGAQNEPFTYNPMLNQARRGNQRGFGDLGQGRFRDTMEENIFTEKMRLQQRTGYTNETIAETYTRRLGTLFGKDSADAAKAVAPAFDPIHGGNIADVLGAVGATNALTYLRIQNADLTTGGIDPNLLSQVAGGSRRNARAQALAGLRPTGSGAASMFAFDNEMANISQLPGGRDSLAYAQAYAGFRSARSQDFQQGTLSGFGLRDLQLQGEQQRQQYMPFAPGNVFATSLGIIANNRGQIGRLNQQLSLNDLSEQERYGLESQRQGLMTENARNVGMLSEGFENRLPALAAGRPAFAGRYNSAQGAAINLGRIGSPVRAYGAGSGSQAAMQDQFVRGLGGDFHGATSPMSRTMDLNTTNDILQRILQALTKNGGASSPGRDRPPPRVGPDSVDPQQKAAWNSR